MEPGVSVRTDRFPTQELVMTTAFGRPFAPPPLLGQPRQPPLAGFSLAATARMDILLLLPLHGLPIVAGKEGARSTALGEVLRTEGFWARQKGDIFRNLRYCEVPCDAFASVADKRKISATLQGAELETVRSTPCFRAAHAFLTCIPRVRAQEHETTRLDNAI